MGEAEDPLTPNLHHVLYDECDDHECPIHHPIGAPGMNRRDLALYIAGAQAATQRFLYATDKDLGIRKPIRYSARIRLVESSIRGDVEKWLLKTPKDRQKIGRIKRSRRSLRTFK